MNEVEDKINVTQSMSAEVGKTPSAVSPTGSVKRETRSTNVVVMYHSNCTDGWCSAYQLKKHFKLANLIPVGYSDPVPEVPEGTDILIIADFSFKAEVLLDMKSKVKEIVVLDHHKTAKDQLEGLDFCTFDMNESGASLVAKYIKSISPGYVAPWFVDYVKDRDLWTWKLPNSREVSEYIRLFDYTVEAWDELSKGSAEQGGVIGASLLKAKKITIDQILKSAIRTKYDGHDIVVVNSTCFQSELGEAACESEGVAFAAIFSVRSDNRISVSFRSKGFDVSREAMRYGGGGHVMAAGCVFDKFEDFVREIIRQ